MVAVFVKISLREMCAQYARVNVLTYEQFEEINICQHQTDSDEMKALEKKVGKSNLQGKKVRSKFINAKFKRMTNRNFSF